MITAHLPSGYVLAQMQGWTGWLMIAALVGAVFPDLDLLFFYFVDGRAFHHHRYWVHAPAFAVAVIAIGAAFAWVAARRLLPVVLAFGAGWFVHIVLDSLTGGIMWFWPFGTDLYHAITVPPRAGVHWLVAFLIHWTMVFELAIWLTALTLWRRSLHHG